MSQTYKPGQHLTCTVTALPKAADDCDTIARLMRNDPSSKRALAKAQRTRRQRMNVYNRGNRDWVSRETCAKVVRVVTGQTWSMAFLPHMTPDLAKVGKFLNVAAR
jgi:hypothetical protein